MFAVLCDVEGGLAREVGGVKNEGYRKICEGGGAGLCNWLLVRHCRVYGSGCQGGGRGDSEGENGRKGGMWRIKRR